MGRKSTEEMKNQETFTRLPYFDWDKTKHFYYVAKFLSLSEAARFLNLSQPALSKKITILEDHLNCKLFIRKPHGLNLSRKGQELFSIVEKYYFALKGFSYSASVMTHKGHKRKIRVSTTHPMASYIFNEHFITFNEKNPNIIFEVICHNNIIDISVNDVDILIRPYDKDTEGIEQEYLLTLQKKLFASHTYIEKYGTPQSIEDLKNHRFIIGSPYNLPFSDINWSLRLGMSEGQFHEPVYTSNNLECLVEAAMRGVGILGAYESMKLIKDSCLINILPHVCDKPIDIYIIYPSFLKKDSVIIEIINDLKSKFSS